MSVLFDKLPSKRKGLRYRIALTPVAGSFSAPPDIRLRRFLKNALRIYGFRADTVEDLSVAVEPKPLQDSDVSLWNASEELNAAAGQLLESHRHFREMSKVYRKMSDSSAARAASRVSREDGISDALYQLSKMQARVSKIYRLLWACSRDLESSYGAGRDVPDSV